MKKKKSKCDKNISLNPLTADEALKILLSTPAPPNKTTKKDKPNNQNKPE